MLCVLGLSALITPLVLPRQLLRLDMPLMIGVSVLLFVLALDGTIGRLEGALLVAAIVSYTWFLIARGRRQYLGRNSDHR